MPIIEYNGKRIEVKRGTNLRKACREAGLSLHNGSSRWLNCKGLGTCGTCAVEIEGNSIGPLTAQEKWRLNFPPHQMESGLRLACQIKVEGDLKLKKHPGFWGEGKEEK